jgi:hypothetical protein
LLKTFGPNDVLLLASLIATGDERLKGYYGSEMKSELPAAPDAKGDVVGDAMFQSDYNSLLIVEPKRKLKFELHVPSHLAKVVGVFIPKMMLRVTGQKTIPPEEGKNFHVLFLTCY